ncbi:M20 metallopeptidase family protein [Cohnella nanjingensis]|uniref:Amidohydrolase n=1 Tax=Cohnella nanjingensis TaxID=1387779 RepID=A0A7X0RZX6_9BACL|nr:amidohydrolase [Cohnella nanjingensis]MBB6675139.1 amidohydrolase [Cohnella nanjingensis]
MEHEREQTAGIDLPAVWRLLDEREETWISLRRAFHRDPEILFEVNRTAARVAELLTGYGLEVRERVGRHFGKGVVGVLHGGRPGQTILLRADMDALPIREAAASDYRSEHEGAMHACGHDAHMAMLLAAAYGLASCRKRLAGTVLFVFQPAEEGAAPSPTDGVLRSGGRDLVEDGVADEASLAIAFHVWPWLPVGQMAVHRKEAMAASTHFQVVFRGRSGHHGSPHLAADALLMAAHFAVEARSAVSAAVDPLAPVAFAFGKLEAGTVCNAIAESAEVQGTYRTFEEDAVQRIRSLLERCAVACADRFGGTCELRFRMGKALINDGEAVKLALLAGERVFGAERVQVLDQPSMAGEDFAYYLDKAPGAMILIGVRNEERGIVHPLHHPSFDLDERALTLGAKLYVQLVADALAAP